jgi:hypothetical protein
MASIEMSVPSSITSSCLEHSRTGQNRAESQAPAGAETRLDQIQTRASRACPRILRSAYPPESIASGEAPDTSCKSLAATVPQVPSV